MSDTAERWEACRWIVYGTQKELNAVLPAWTLDLPIRAKRALLLEHYFSLALPDLSPRSVLNLGEYHWRRVPNLGRVSIDAMWLAATTANPTEWERYQQAWRFAA